MKYWTKQCLNRDRSQWPYAHWLYDQDGEIVIETTHRDKTSLRIECNISVKRIKEGRPNRGGQIPTGISVDGLPETEWRQWVCG